jgi:hypothetical protein
MPAICVYRRTNKIHQCIFDVLSMTFGDNGVVVDGGRTYTLQLPEETYKRVATDGLVYYVTVPVKARRLSASVGAYNNRSD